VEYNRWCARGVLAYVEGVFGMCYESAISIGSLGQSVCPECGIQLVVVRVGRLPLLKVCFACAMEVRFQSAVCLSRMWNTFGGVAHGALAYVEGVFCMCYGSAILISSLGQSVCPGCGIHLVVLRVGRLPSLKVCFACAMEVQF